MYTQWTQSDKGELIRSIAEGELGDWEEMADTIPTHSPAECESFIDLLNAAAGTTFAHSHTTCISTTTMTYAY